MGISREIMTIYDQPMWDSIKQRDLRLQRCAECATTRYPPAACCPTCLSMQAEWISLEGRGKILSWVVFHRKYFDDFVPPYNSIAVQLAEGPIMISNLAGDVPDGSWIGCDVELCYIDTGVRVLPQFKLLTGQVQ